MLYAVDDHQNGSSSSFNFHGMPQKYAVSVAKSIHTWSLFQTYRPVHHSLQHHDQISEVPATKVQTPIEKNPLKE